jgi:Heterokaryon incompatibility protein (HET)
LNLNSYQALKASLVLIWLGDTANQSDVAMEWLRSFPPTRDQIAGRRQRGDCHEKAGGSPAEITVNTAIAKFAERPYWQRVWVVQEILQAHELLVWCGDQQVDWACLENFSDWINVPRNGKGHILPSLPYYLIDNNVRHNQIGNGNGPSLPYLINNNVRHQLMSSSMATLAGSRQYFDMKSRRNDLESLL